MMLLCLTTEFLKDDFMALSSISDCTVSAIVCASREGTLIHRTLASLAEAMAEAMLAGFRCETLVALHDADESTAAFAHDRRGPGLRVVELGSSDRIETRNAAVRLAQGRYLAWLDAGDICCRSWIRAAATRAMADQHEVVWHPAHCVVLGAPFRLVPCADRDNGAFEPAAGFWVPLYPYAALVPRSLYTRFPFRPHDRLRGYLGGDWAWGNDTAAAGVPHKTVPETVIGILPDAPPDRINVGSATPVADGLRPPPTARF